MRRGLWLAAGAVLGVAGYRRASRMVDTLARGGLRAVVPPGQHRGGARGVVPPSQYRGGLRAVVPPGQHRGGLRGVVPPSQHRGGSGSARQRAVHGSAVTVTTGVAGRPDSAGHPTPGRPAGTAAKIAATAGFVRDVRDGMAEYLELHHRELARNLGGRSNRTSSG
jgi:hypothetical protein